MNSPNLTVGTDNPSLPHFPGVAELKPALKWKLATPVQLDTLHMKSVYKTLFLDRMRIKKGEINDIKHPF